MVSLLSQQAELVAIEDALREASAEVSAVSSAASAVTSPYTSHHTDKSSSSGGERGAGVDITIQHHPLHSSSSSNSSSADLDFPATTSKHPHHHIPHPSNPAVLEAVERAIEKRAALTRQLREHLKGYYESLLLQDAVFTNLEPPRGSDAAIIAEVADPFHDHMDKRIHIHADGRHHDSDQVRGWLGRIWGGSRRSDGDEDGKHDHRGDGKGRKKKKDRLIPLYANGHPDDLVALGMNNRDSLEKLVSRWTAKVFPHRRLQAWEIRRRCGESLENEVLDVVQVLSPVTRRVTRFVVAVVAAGLMLGMFLSIKRSRMKC